MQVCIGLQPVSEEKTVVKHEPTTDSSDDLRTSRKKF